MGGGEALRGILAAQRFVVLDGGLATELERRGADLRDPLWSARVLLQAPELIREVHAAFLRAGADVVATASYQATFPGLARQGLSAAEAERVLRRSVALGREARDEVAASGGLEGRPPPLVAASIGSYGAFLHDGSEYRGDYGLTDRELARFHRDRLAVLAAAGPDLLALETIPSRREGEVLVDLLEREGGPPAWVSFTGRDERAIADGTPFADVVHSLSGSARVVAVGINCTAPHLIGPLLRSAGGLATQPFVVYPNSGEIYDARTGSWNGEVQAGWVEAHVEEWLALGARLVGGCCRTGPEAIAALRQKAMAPAGGPDAA